MRFYLHAASLLFLVVPALSQTVHTGKAETIGPCSPAVTGTNNQFTITCSGISDKLGPQLVELMNRVATNQLDAQAIMSKLDGCLAQLKVVKDQQEPWHISPTQKSQLEAILATFPLSPTAKANITVAVLPSERNASLFGIDLMEVFKKYKWVPLDSGMTSDFTLPPQLVGYTVIVTHRDFPQAAALVTALSQAGLNPDIFIDEKKIRVHDDNDIQIAIGAKPVPVDPGVTK